MRENYKCPHGTTTLLIGSHHGVYCPECKMWLFSKEETTKREMSLNKDKQKRKGLYTSINW